MIGQTNTNSGASSGFEGFSKTFSYIQNGVIKIDLPKPTEPYYNFYGIISFVVDITSIIGITTTLKISCRPYFNSLRWFSTNAVNYSDDEANSLDVKFGKDNQNNMCIVIGNNSDSYNTPTVTVRDLHLDYNDQYRIKETEALFFQEWNITIGNNLSFYNEITIDGKDALLGYKEEVSDTGAIEEFNLNTGNGVVIKLKKINGIVNGIIKIYWGNYLQNSYIDASRDTIPFITLHASSQENSRIVLPESFRTSFADNDYLQLETFVYGSVDGLQAPLPIRKGVIELRFGYWLKLSIDRRDLKSSDHIQTYNFSYIAKVV